VLAGIVMAVGVAVACTDLATRPVDPVTPLRPDGPTRSLNAACAVTYNSITYNSDSETAEYGVPARTDTSAICETWTGSDYYLRSTRIGSSEPASETSEEVRTVVYSAGSTTAYLADGTPLAPAQSVGPDAFAFGQATEAERQASYNDPYYGIAQSQQPGGCPNDPTAIICTSTSQLPSSEGAFRSVGSTIKEHGHRRRALKALLRDKDEVPGAPPGMRRFRSVAGDEETFIDVDNADELIRSQETKSPSSRTTAKLHWTLRGNRFVRERMEIDGEEVRKGRTYRSKVIVLLDDVRFAASVQP